MPKEEPRRSGSGSQRIPATTRNPGESREAAWAHLVRKLGKDDVLQMLFAGERPTAVLDDLLLRRLGRQLRRVRRLLPEVERSAHTLYLDAAVGDHREAMFQLRL